MSASWAAVALASVAVGWWLRDRSGSGPAVARALGALRREVDATRRAVDHQVASMDRRMVEVETAAALAAAEAKVTALVAIELRQDLHIERDSVMTWVANNIAALQDAAEDAARPTVSEAVVAMVDAVARDGAASNGAKGT